MILIDSRVLLQCFGFTLKENDSGNLKRGKLWFVFPPYMSCIGKKPPFNETVNVPVMHRLSLDPAIPMDFEPFLAKVWFALGIYFSFVWSRFKIRLSGTLWSSTRDTISCKYKSSSSFFLHWGFQSCQLFSCIFWSSFCEKSFLPKMMSPGQCDLTSNVGF